MYIYKKIKIVPTRPDFVLPFTDTDFFESESTDIDTEKNPRCGTDTDTENNSWPSTDTDTD